MQSVRQKFMTHPPPSPEHVHPSTQEGKEHVSSPAAQAQLVVLAETLGSHMALPAVAIPASIRFGSSRPRTKIMEEIMADL
mmetsp:Transcript_16562/g.35819  ORF Transcript_16562/g.35819 Transcript_16562/m.35819 type:complete len:81 (-) Transcript_16562:76-318(-)